MKRPFEKPLQGKHYLFTIFIKMKYSREMQLSHLVFNIVFKLIFFSRSFVAGAILICSWQLFKSRKSQISNRKYNCRFLDITFLIGDAFKLYCMHVVFKSTIYCPSKFKFLSSTFPLFSCKQASRYSNWEIKTFRLPFFVHRRYPLTTATNTSTSKTRFLFYDVI